MDKFGPKHFTPTITNARVERSFRNCTVVAATDGRKAGARLNRVACAAVNGREIGCDRVRKNKTKEIRRPTAADGRAGSRRTNIIEIEASDNVRAFSRRLQPQRALVVDPTFQRLVV